jgi:hypothetical protein
MPDVIKQADDLSHRAEIARDHATSEIDAMGPMDKGKCIGAFASNIKILPKIPKYIK